MKKNPTPTPKQEPKLRQKAEKALSKKKAVPLHKLSEADALKLIHELQVHQIELEPQNEELQKANFATAEVSTRFTELYDLAPAAYFTLDKEGVIHHTNLAGAALLGEVRSKVNSRHLAFSIANESKPAFNSFLKSIALHKSKQTCEAVLVAGNDRKHIIFSGVPDGIARQYLITAVDVTEQKKKEAQIVNAKNRFQALVQNSPFCIHEISLEGNLLSMNPAGLQMMGVTKEEEITGTPYLNGVCSIDKPRIEGLMLEATHNEVHQFEFAADNGHVYKSNFVPISDESGTVIRLMGISEDITERITAENKISLLQQKYLVILNAANGIVWEADAQTFQFTFVSGQAEAILGYPIHRWTEEPTFWKDHIHPEDSTWAVDYRLSCTLKNQAHDFEYRMTAADGRVVWLHDIVTVESENGMPVLLRGLMVDITKRKQAEEALHRSEAEVRAQLREIEQIYTYSPIGLFIFDREYRFQRINERMAEINGFSVAHHFGKTLDEIAPDLAGFLKEVYRPIFEKGEPVLNVEIHGKTPRDPDHECDWIGNYFPLKSETGEVIGLIGAVLDITERKQAENKLRDQAMLLDLANDAILVRNLKSEVVFWNRGAEQTYGWTNAEALGNVTHDLLHTVFPVSRETVDQALLRENIWEGELTHTRSSGAQIIVTSRQVLLRDEHGQPIRILEINRDITERKQSEIELQKTKDLLTITNRMVRIGGWEIDLIKNQVTWTDITREIHEVDFDFVNTVENGINFYKEGVSRESILHSVSHAIETGEGFNLELQLVTAKGNELWVQVIGQAEFAGDKVVRLYGTFKDIDADKKNRLKIEESEINLKETQSIAKLGRWDFNRVTNQLHWSDSVFEIFEIDKKQFGATYEAFLNTIHPDDRQLVNDAIARSSETKQPYKIEYRLQMADGRIKHLIGSGRTDYYEKGKPLRSVGIVQDVTEQKQAEEKLRENQTRFEMALIAGNQGAWLYDWKNDTNFVDERWAAMLGYSLEEVGQTLNFWESRVHPDDLKKLYSVFERHDRGEIPMIDVDVRARTKNGEWKWFSDRAQILKRMPNGKPWIMAGTISDITERKQSEIERQLITVRLKLATKAANVGIWDYHIVENQLIWDDQMFALYGITREKFIGVYEAWRAGLHPDDIEHQNKETELAVKGEKEYDTEFRAG